MCKLYPLECAEPGCTNTVPPHYIWGESCYQSFGPNPGINDGVRRHYVPGTKPSGWCGQTRMMPPYKHKNMLCEAHLQEQRKREEEERKKEREREGLPRGMGHLMD